MQHHIIKSVLAQRIVCAIIVCASATAWGSVPILNSDYQAPHVLYLDFDGHYQPASVYRCPGGSPEGWPIDFSTTDISNAVNPNDVTAIWEAVAEDFAPFQVNVTTDPRYEPAAGKANAVRIAIGIPSLSGGLGFAPAVCESNQLANPPYLNAHIANVAVVHLDPLSVHTTQAAKRISHEAGHLYGLIHHIAPAGLLDDWIMAPQRAAYRYIWRNGTNEFSQPQNDVEHLAALLGRRPDEPNPSQLKSTGISISGKPSILYARATLATAGDWDDFLFTTGNQGVVEFRLSPGIWTSASNPTIGAEPNARYRFSIYTENGWQALACPSSTVLTMSVATQPTLGLDCSNHPPALRAGRTYRIRVFRDGTSSQPGNIGRYTLTVKDVTPQPPQPQPIPRFR
jgi:hypothetical protein